MKNTISSLLSALFAGLLLCLIMASPVTARAEIIRGLPNGALEQKHGNLTFWQGATQEDISYYNMPYSYLQGFWTVVHLTPPVLFMLGVAAFKVAPYYAPSMLGAGMLFQTHLLFQNHLKPFWQFHADHLAKPLFWSFMANSAYQMGRYAWRYTEPVSTTVYPVMFQNAPLLAMFVQDVVEANEQKRGGDKMLKSSLRLISTLTDDAFEKLKTNDEKESDTLLELPKLLKDKNAYIDITLGWEQGTLVNEQWHTLSGSSVSTDMKGMASGVLPVRLIGPREKGGADEILDKIDFDLWGQHRWIEGVLISTDKTLEEGVEYTSLVSPEMQRHLSDWIEKNSRWQGVMVEGAEYQPGPKLYPLPRKKKREFGKSNGSGCKPLNMGDSKLVLPSDLSLPPSMEGCLKVVSKDKEKNHEVGFDYVSSTDSVEYLFINWLSRMVVTWVAGHALNYGVNRVMSGYAVKYDHMTVDVDPDNRLVEGKPGVKPTTVLTVTEVSTGDTFSTAKGPAGVIDVLDKALQANVKTGDVAGTTTPPPTFDQSMEGGGLEVALLQGGITPFTVGSEHLPVDVDLTPVVVTPIYDASEAAGELQAQNFQTEDVLQQEEPQHGQQITLLKHDLESVPLPDNLGEGGAEGSVGSAIQTQTSSTPVSFRTSEDMSASGERNTHRSRGHKRRNNRQKKKSANRDRSGTPRQVEASPLKDKKGKKKLTATSSSPSYFPVDPGYKKSLTSELSVSEALSPGKEPVFTDSKTDGRVEAGGGFQLRSQGRFFGTASLSLFPDQSKLSTVIGRALTSVPRTGTEPRTVAVERESNSMGDQSTSVDSEKVSIADQSNSVDPEDVSIADQSTSVDPELSDTGSTASVTTTEATPMVTQSAEVEGQELTTPETVAQDVETHVATVGVEEPQVENNLVTPEGGGSGDQAPLTIDAENDHERSPTLLSSSPELREGDIVRPGEEGLSVERRSPSDTPATEPPRYEDLAKLEQFGQVSMPKRAMQQAYTIGTEERTGSSASDTGSVVESESTGSDVEIETTFDDPFDTVSVADEAITVIESTTKLPVLRWKDFDDPDVLWTSVKGLLETVPSITTTEEVESLIVAYGKEIKNARQELSESWQQRLDALEEKLADVEKGNEAERKRLEDLLDAKRALSGKQLKKQQDVHYYGASEIVAREMQISLSGRHTESIKRGLAGKMYGLKQIRDMRESGDAQLAMTVVKPMIGKINKPALSYRKGLSRDDLRVVGASIAQGGGDGAVDVFEDAMGMKATAQKILEDSLKDNENKLAELQEKLSTAQNQFEAAKREVEGFQAEIQHLEEEAPGRQGSLPESEQEPQGDGPRVEGLHTELASAEARFREAQGKLNYYKEQVETMEEMVASESGRLAEVLSFVANGGKTYDEMLVDSAAIVESQMFEDLKGMYSAAYQEAKLGKRGKGWTKKVLSAKRFIANQKRFIAEHADKAKEINEGMLPKSERPKYREDRKGYLKERVAGRKAKIQSEFLNIYYEVQLAVMGPEEFVRLRDIKEMQHMEVDELIAYMVTHHRLNYDGSVEELREIAEQVRIVGRHDYLSVGTRELAFRFAHSPLEVIAELVPERYVEWLVRVDYKQLTADALQAHYESYKLFLRKEWLRKHQLTGLTPQVLPEIPKEYFQVQPGLLRDSLSLVRSTDATSKVGAEVRDADLSRPEMQLLFITNNLYYLLSGFNSMQAAMPEMSDDLTDFIEGDVKPLTTVSSGRLTRFGQSIIGLFDPDLATPGGYHFVEFRYEGRVAGTTDAFQFR